MRAENRRAIRFGSMAGVLGSFLLFLAAAEARAQTSRPAHAGMFGATDNAAQTTFNPAGLTRIEGSELVTQFLAFSSSSRFRTTADSFPGESVVTTDESDVFVPAVFYAQNVTDRLGLGVSLFVPGGIGGPAH